MAVTTASQASPSDSPSFSERKDWELLFHVLAQLLLVVAIAWGANWLWYDRGERHDLTASKAESLAEKTRTILDGLEEDKVRIEVVSLIDPKQSSGRFTDDAMRLIRDRLNETCWHFRDYTDLFDYRILDVHLQKAEVDDVAREHSVEEDNLVLVLATFGDKTTQKKFLRPADLAIPPQDFFSGKLIEAYKGEEAIAQAIRTVTVREPVPVYHTTGHGELDLARKSASLVAFLEDEAYTFAPCDLRVQGRVPDDCKVLVIAGGDRPFGPVEANAVLEYVRGGGGLLLLGEVGWNTGLDDVLDEVGIDLRDDLVWVEQQMLRLVGGGVESVGGGILTYEVDTKELGASHPVTRGLAERDYRVDLLYARSVAPLGGDSTAKYSGLVKTDDKSWGLVNYRGWTPAVVENGPSQNDHKGPLDIAAAVTKYYGDPALESTVSSRAVCVGDATFFEDEFLKRQKNREFAYLAILWLAGRDPVVLPPPETGEWKAELEDSEFWKGVLLPLLILPFATLCLGVIVWLVRRF
ncbi:MAG: Gldg family protein [Planctomycetes bacterium]|nr:Gldg family protein [Planctomycetota bacterium]